MDKVFQETEMLKKFWTKWFVLALGVSILPVAVGQCVADLMEDTIIFSIVD